MRARARVAAAALALAALAVSTTACGGTAGSPRAQVDRYVESVNAITAGEETETARTQAALDHFSRTTPAEHAALLRATRSCVRLAARVHALHPPLAADTVQRRLAELMNADLAAVAAATALNSYLAAQAKPEAGLRAAERTLAAGMRSSVTPVAQEELFSRFAAAVAAARTSLAAVSAPVAERRWKASQLSQLDELETTAQQLSEALRRRDAAALRSLLARLQAELRGAAQVAAEREAVAAYNRLARRVRAADLALAGARAALVRRFS